MKTKILLVDDEPDIVEFLKYNLEMNGYDVVVGYDGIQALNNLSQNPDLKRFYIRQQSIHLFICKVSERRHLIKRCF